MNSQDNHPYSVPQDLRGQIQGSFEFGKERAISKDFIVQNRGCYTLERVNDLPFDEKDEITLTRLFEVLPIKHFTWFLINKVLPLKSAQYFALDCAKFVFPIWAEKYPDDKAVINCIQKTELYLRGEVSVKEFKAAYAAAYAAANAFAVTDAATFAAYAAANATAAADDADYAAYWAASAAANADAAYAYYAADDADYAASAAQDDFKSFVENWLQNFFN